MPQEIGIDGPVGKREPQLRHHPVFHLFPHQYRIEFFVFHIGIQLERVNSPQLTGKGKQRKGPVYGHGMPCPFLAEKGRTEAVRPKNKTPRPEPGHSFLQEIMYHTIHRFVKNKIGIFFLARRRCKASDPSGSKALSLTWN
jgi:hypothetical protein